MSIALDTTADGGEDVATSLTWTHTCTGSDLILFVAIASGTADDIAGVTYNGVPLTLVDKIAARFFYVYMLVGPATGSHSVVVSASSSHILGAVSASYTGAAQSGQPDASVQNSVGTGTTLTTSITTVANNSWVFLAMTNYDNGIPPSAGTGATFRIAGAVLGEPGLFDSDGPVSPAGSYSMTTTEGADPFNVGIGHILVSFSPASSGATRPGAAFLAIGNPLRVFGGRN